MQKAGFVIIIQVFVLFYLKRFSFVLNMVSNILIIDDEEKLRSLLARIISLEGFTVYQAGDLRSALKILQKEEFDVVLCDVKLPDGNGVDFAKRIKIKISH